MSPARVYFRRDDRVEGDVADVEVSPPAPPDARRHCSNDFDDDVMPHVTRMQSVVSQWEEKVNLYFERFKSRQVHLQKEQYIASDAFLKRFSIQFRLGQYSDKTTNC